MTVLSALRSPGLGSRDSRRDMNGYREHFMSHRNLT